MSLLDVRFMQNTSENDCIVAWSGGVESTALLYQLLLEKRNPLVIHIEIFNNDVKANMFETLAVERMESLLDVEVNYVEYKSIITQPNKSKEFWKHRKYGGGYPTLPIWSTITFLTQINHPWCTDIYIGKNSKDGNGEQWELARRYVEEQGKLFGFESRMSAPLEQLDKREQWLTIPREIRPFVRTCLKPTAKECGVCSKCREKEEIL